MITRQTGEQYIHDSLKREYESKNHHCEDCAYAKDSHMPGKVYCGKSSEFVERTRIPECYNCSFFTNMNSKKEKKNETRVHLC